MICPRFSFRTVSSWMCLSKRLLSLHPKASNNVWRTYKPILLIYSTAKLGGHYSRSTGLFFRCSEYYLLLREITLLYLCHCTQMAMVKSIEPENYLTADEERFLLAGTTTGQQKDTVKPVAPWVSDAIWREICALSALPIFSGLCFS